MTLLAALLFLLPLIGHASDVKTLTSIKGFKTGMEVDEFESHLSISVDHFEMLDPSLTLPKGYKVWSLGKCVKKAFLGYCSERKQSNLTIGGVGVSSIYYYPESKTVRFDLGVYDYTESGPELNYQSYADAQELAKYLTNQYQLEWDVHIVECGATGCVTEYSLHQVDRRFITLGKGSQGASYVFIELSLNAGETD